jgi:hypothetical protein
MTITKEIKEAAQALGRKHKLAKVWVNESGEVFSEEQFAKASVKGDKDKYAPVEVTAEVKEKEKATNDIGTVQEVIAGIEAAETAEAVQAIIDSEKAGKNRVTVITAAEKKLNTFNQ